MRLDIGLFESLDEILKDLKPMPAEQFEFISSTSKELLELILKNNLPEPIISEFDYSGVDFQFRGGSIPDDVLTHRIVLSIERNRVWLLSTDDRTDEGDSRYVRNFTTDDLFRWLKVQLHSVPWVPFSIQDH